ncbi:MAG: hypothetical protein U0326_23785 [Polyangiales bacterium]
MRQLGRAPITTPTRSPGRTPTDHKPRTTAVTRRSASSFVKALPRQRKKVAVGSAFARSVRASAGLVRVSWVIIARRRRRGSW